MSSQPPASTEEGDAGPRARSRNTSASWLSVCASSAASECDENERELLLLLDADLTSWNACARVCLQLVVAYKHIAVAVVPLTACSSV